MEPKTRKIAGWSLIALLIAVFPANLHIAINQIPLTADPINPVVMWARLPFQALFIFWVWYVSQKLKT